MRPGPHLDFPLPRRRGRDAQAAGHRASTRQLTKCPGDETSRTVRNFFAGIAFIQKKRSDAKIVQPPDGTIDDEMMQIDECGKGEKVDGKIGAEYADKIRCGIGYGGCLIIAARMRARRLFNDGSDICVCRRSASNY
jgi:hypothetical protein